jgi:hypothetical protein
MEPIQNETKLRPQLDAKGLAQHGATWGALNEIVLRATSRGPGVPVEVRHPLTGGPVRQVTGGDGVAALKGGKLFMTPAAAVAGQEFTVTVEV